MYIQMTSTDQCIEIAEILRNKGMAVDVEIPKEELINKVLEKYNIVTIFEDCEPIVQRFREMGLTVLQPNKGL